MSDSIKPPGGPPSSPPPPSEVRGPADGRFRAELESVGAPSASSTRLPAELSGVAEGLRAGTLTPDAAISQLLERQLGSGPARALAPAARLELERLLRARLEDDPALRALAADLARAR